LCIKERLQKKLRKIKSVAFRQQVVEDVTRQATPFRPRFRLIDALPDGIEFSEELLTLKTGRAVPCPWKTFYYMKKGLVSLVVFSGLVTVLFLSLTGCSSTSPMESGKGPTTKSDGHQLDHTIVSLISNAKVGGTLGTMINKQMDRQASELASKLKDAKVMRFEEGILITIDSRLLFEEDSHQLQSTNGMLKDFARILKKYDYTSAFIEGHTDNVGEEIYNTSLSERRAHEIENYLIGKGINDSRMKTRGYGERQPIASNDTESGRQLNRRIEIALFASENLRLATTPQDSTYTALKQ
jgi:outer membrane protein OmpA-like peptidoglycan-associated protein